MPEPLFRFKTYAQHCFDVTLMAGNNERIGSVKKMDRKWWAVSPHGKGDGPHPTRIAAAHWLLRQRNSGPNPEPVDL